MTRNFITLILSLSGFFAISCRTADEANTAAGVDVNASANIAAVENTNSVKSAAAAVPIFADAVEASAAGDKYLDRLETENAVNAFSQAVKLNPDFAEAYFKLGIAYSLREKETGVSGYETESEPTPPAQRQSKKGKKDQPVLTDAEKAFESAAGVYEKILEKSPKDDQALYNLGRAYNKLNKDSEAEKALREAVKLKPEDAEYQTEFGSILIKLAQYDEAVTVLNKAVKLDETNLQAQDLLERAEAGKKRVNFGIKPKLPQQQPEPEIVRPRAGKAKPKSPANPSEQLPLPPTANANSK